MTESQTLTDLLGVPTASQPAIIADPADVVISYQGLAEQVERLAEELCGVGLKPGDVVALVLPNGPELLVLVLALTRASLIAAPVNPAFKADELESLFAELKPRAVVTIDIHKDARSCAANLSIPAGLVALDLSGLLRLDGLNSTTRISPTFPSGEDVAILLHTSGTEARPKLVPLTHANVLLSARHIAQHYALTPLDRTVAVMPLFHGHGLIGVALATLASGGTVIVPPRFSASHFWGTFRRHGATWYSAVPTIHEILLTRADTDQAPRSSARFIRSCSSALPPPVLAALEARFGAPVIEAYGITEATHQVASNPLPPKVRKAGSVGIATGTEVAIIDATGRPLPTHAEGEVVVRGPTIMQGYCNNPDATAAAFIDGWFRTGDAGFLDEHGYLVLTGRLKEIINRGGEKISPVEIDNVLLAHPAVAEAAAFGVPDVKYGEEVNAAVVLKGNVDEKALRSFAEKSLAGFKVPKVIRIVAALPRNALGKVERRTLASLYSQPSPP